MMSCKIVQDQLDNVIHYLQPLLPLANFHMVDYFTKDAYRNHIPKDIQEEISSFDEKSVAIHIFDKNLKDMAQLREYIKKSEQFTLKNCKICLDLNQFQDKLHEWGCENVSSLKLDIFMSSKKSHEVEILASLAAAVRCISGTSHVIDVGDGKGYLSSMLALHHKIPVLGVDASAVNTNGAVERVQKLSKIWNSVVHKDDNSSRETSASLYKQITRYVDEKVNFNDLIENIYLEKPTGLSLVGLHTCGNLAAASLRIFSASEHIRSICNVGCCYHLITEIFEQDQNRGHVLDDGFPMSEYLKKKQFVIGRAARMIAAQSVERILNKKELPNKTLFYRALFEVLIELKCQNIPPDRRQVGRFRKECVSFNDYVRKASERINIELAVTEEEIEDLFKEYESRNVELNNFYLIRCMLAPIIENLILLDRLLFLLEQGYERSFLVQLFDPIVSPRCYGIVALK